MAQRSKGMTLGDVIPEGMLESLHQANAKAEMLKLGSACYPDFTPIKTGGFNPDKTPRTWHALASSCPSITKSIFRGGVLVNAHIDVRRYLDGHSVTCKTWTWMVNKTHFAQLTLPERVRVYPVTQKSQRWGLNPAGTNLYVDQRDENDQSELVEILSPGFKRRAQELKGTDQAREVMRSESLVNILGTMGLLRTGDSGFGFGKHTDDLFHIWTLKFKATQNLTHFTVKALRDFPDVEKLLLSNCLDSEGEISCSEYCCYDRKLVVVTEKEVKQSDPPNNY